MCPTSQGKAPPFPILFEIDNHLQVLWESIGLREFKQTTDAQLVHTVGLGYLVKSDHTTLSSALEVQNVTDEAVFDFFGVQRPGRLSTSRRRRSSDSGKQHTMRKGRAMSAAHLNRRGRRRRTAPETLALLGLLTVASCGGGEGKSNGDAGGDNNGPVYVVFSTIDTPDGRTGYVVTTSSIEGDVAVDVTKGIESPGGGQLYAPPGEGYFLLGSGEEPTFTRYSLKGDGTFERGATISFANFGVSDVWRHMIFVDPAKAYFLDMTQLQLIKFNPTTMEVDRAIPVDDFECDEVQTEFGAPIRREDGYYFPRSCWDLDVTSSGSSLVHLDPDTDEVTVTHDERCMGMQIGFMADSGHAYWFADHDASIEHSLKPGDTPHDCALRLRAGETTFDPDWELDLTSRTGGLSAVASVPAGGSSVWVKVFEPSAVPAALPLEDIDWSLSSLPTWRWGLLDVEADRPVQVDSQAELVVYYGPPIEVDGRAFSPSTTYAETGDDTMLVELTDSGPRDRMRVQGELRKVFRLR